MGSLAINDNFLLSLFLFGLSFCGVSVVTHTYKHQNLRNSLNQPPRPTTTPQGRYYRLTCLLEDIPQTLLRGQSYQLAMPLLSPIACLLEDAPQTVFKGQTCELATPLMTTLACIVTPTWQAFYTKQLGKPKINYWEWKNLPESDNVCRELSLLLTLPAPKGYTKQVLEALAESKNLFFKPLRNTKAIGNLLIDFADSIRDGKFAKLDWRMQVAMRRAFKQWHELVSQQIGIEALSAIYRVCYGTSSEKIQQIIHEERSILEDFIADNSTPWWKVLGVSSSADALQVEKAYKTLIRLWHPDLNKHPYATQVTSRINVAYAHYQSLDRISSTTEQMSIENHSNLLNKIREWLKPLFSH
jgi:DnaJ domain